MEGHPTIPRGPSKCTNAPLHPPRPKQASSASRRSSGYSSSIASVGWMRRRFSAHYENPPSKLQTALLKRPASTCAYLSLAWALSIARCDRPSMNSMCSARPLARAQHRENVHNDRTSQSSSPCPVSAGSTSLHCWRRLLGLSAAVTIRDSGRCPVLHLLPGAAASRTLSSCATPRMFDYARRSIIGPVSPPSTIPRVALAMLLYANAVTPTDVPCAVLQTDCLAWPASFCSDRRHLIRTMVNRRKRHLFDAPKVFQSPS